MPHRMQALILNLNTCNVNHNVLMLLLNEEHPEEILYKRQVKLSATLSGERKLRYSLLIMGMDYGLVTQLFNSINSKKSQLARFPLEDCLPNSLGPHTANTCPKLLCDSSAKGSEISKEQDDPKNTR